MRNILKKIYLNPFRAFVYVLLKYLPNKIFKKRFFFNKKLDKKYFLISFDCDVQEDIKCLPILLSKLDEIGIKPSLAIPGELIENNITLIKDLMEKHNIEFINHGYYIHTEIYDNISVSTKSYLDTLKDKILKDIELGHKVLADKLKLKPKGFRAPHFGEINFTLRKMINNKIKNSEEFKNKLNKCKELFFSSDFNYINIYVDPSHVINEKYFFDFLNDMSRFSKYNLTEFSNEYIK